MYLDMVLELEHAHRLLANEAVGLLLLRGHAHHVGHGVQLHQDTVLLATTHGVARDGGGGGGCSGARLAVAATWLQLELKGRGGGVGTRPERDQKLTSYVQSTGSTHSDPELRCSFYNFVGKFTGSPISENNV
jgi:hypothetical protein